MISCADAVRQMWDYIERELDPKTRDGVDEHLARCRRCCGEMEFAEQLRRFMARRADLALPAAVEVKLDRLLHDLEKGAT